MDLLKLVAFDREDMEVVSVHLQDAIVKAGKEAAAFGRDTESKEDSQKLEALEKAGKLKRVPFTQRAEMQKLVEPVITAYAKEIEADGILAKMAEIK